MSAAITVCIPVYNAAAFVAETLDSVAAQSFPDFKVLISLDESTDESEALCRRALADPRFELIVQPTRLGWVHNINALIERVDTQYFCIMPHDDLIERSYLAELHSLATSDPAIACAYCDVEGFGPDSVRRRGHIQREIRGPLLRRVLFFLLNQSCGTAFRGLITRYGPADRPTLPTNMTDNFAADLVWLMRIAMRGELRRVPQYLYAKRYLPTTVHAPWREKSRREYTQLWAEHTARCAVLALTGFEKKRVREHILMASLMRATGLGPFWHTLWAPRTSVQAAAATAMFARMVPELPPPEESSDIVAHPDARLLRALFAEAKAYAATLPPMYQVTDNPEGPQMSRPR